LQETAARLLCVESLWVQETGERGPGLPIKLGPCSNGEFDPVPLSPIAEAGPAGTRRLQHHARRLGVSRRQFLLSCVAPRPRCWR
jgi:hypothetical protein